MPAPGPSAPTDIPTAEYGLIPCPKCMSMQWIRDRDTTQATPEWDCMVCGYVLYTTRPMPFARSRHETKPRSRRRDTETVDI